MNAVMWHIRKLTLKTLKSIYSPQQKVIKLNNPRLLRPTLRTT